MTIYLNLKTKGGIETVDEFTREAGQSPRDFRRYVNEMARNYRDAKMYVYQSSRCTKDWKTS